MATKYSQPQSPLKMVDEKTGDIEYIYPQTVAKQVIMEDGTRLNAYLNKLVISGGGSGSSSGGGSGVSSLEDLGVLATSTELNYLIDAKANIQEQLDNKVPLDRTINGKSLNSNIDLSAGDIGAYSKTEIDNKLSSIGGGAADWNENDENASGYIKNRTHYSDEIVIFHDTALQKSGEGFPIHVDLDVVDGETYAISVDDEKFICSARQVAINYMGQVTLSGIALGNIYLMDQTFENTGESFIFAKLDSQSASFLGCKSIVGVFTGVTSINFKIAKETYHKLDMKFLPEHLLDMITVDTTDAVETNISSGINADTFCGYPIDYFVMYNVGDGEGEGDFDGLSIDADTLGGIPAEDYLTKLSLMWENADITSSFASQYANGTFDKTKPIFVVYKYQAGANVPCFVEMIMPDILHCPYRGYKSVSIWREVRFESQNSRVAFGNAFYSTFISPNENGTTNNAFLVPYQIYQ